MINAPIEHTRYRDEPAEETPQTRTNLPRPYTWEDNHDTARSHNGLETDISDWDTGGEYQEQPRLTTTSPSSHTQNHDFDLNPALERWQSEDIPFEYDYVQSLGDQPDQHLDHPGQPQTERFATYNSSSPPMIGDPDNWLLPRPFRHEVALPSVGESSLEEAEGGFDLRSPVNNISNAYSVLSTNSSHRTSSTPVASDSVIQSPYFRKEQRMGRKGRRGRDTGGISDRSSSDMTVGTPFYLGLSSSLERYPFSAPAPKLAEYSSDPFVTSEPEIFPDTRERSPRHDYQASKHARNRTDNSGLHRPVRHGSEFGWSSLSDNHLTTLAPSREPHNPRHDLRCYDPSVISGAFTRTLTPYTSPARHNRAPPSVRQRLGNFNETCPPDRIPKTYGEKRHQPTPSPGIRPSKYSKLEVPFQCEQLDSSILTPVALNPRALDAHTPGAQQRKTDPKDMSLLDLDLDFLSDSDSGDDIGHHLDNTMPRPQVNDRLNTRSTLGISEEQDHVVCAISESRSSDVIGMAIINVTMGRVDIIRIVNEDRYQRLIETLWRVPHAPQAFLVLKKVIDEHSKSSLALRLKREFPDAQVVPLEREHWNESEGLRMIDRFAWREDIKAIRSDLEHNFYASCAFSAVWAPTLYPFWILC